MGRQRARWRRKFVHTTDSRHAPTVAANVLARQFSPEAPNRAWVGDITTYARARHGLICSMSRKGHCWVDLGFCHHAVMECFFLNLKMERVWQCGYAHHGQAQTDTADYSVGFYDPLKSAPRKSLNLQKSPMGLSEKTGPRQLQPQ